jgi:hypothetical protein
MCLAGIAILLLALWLTSYMWPMPDQCMGSLVWWTPVYAKVAVVFSASILVTLIACVGVISIQLAKTTKIERDERVAASRMAYSMIVAILILVSPCMPPQEEPADQLQGLILPFYIQVLTGAVADETSRIADIAFNLNGIFYGLLHILLCIGSERLAIKPRNLPRKPKGKTSVFGPYKLSARRKISPPIPPPIPPDPKTAGTPAAENERGIGGKQLPSSPRLQYARQDAAMPKAPSPIHLAPPPKAALRKHHPTSSYSIFPTKTTILRASWDTGPPTNDSEALILPSPFSARGHNREESSATVQFALRLSQAPEIDVKPESPISPLQQAWRVSSVYSPRFQTEYIPLQERLAVPLPQIIQKLRKHDSALDQDNLPVSRRRRDTMKSLPPTPGAGVAESGAR